jgi:Phosphatidylinositol-specific phospholipase C, X domain
MPPIEESTSSIVTLFIYLICILLILIPVSYYFYAYFTQQSSETNEFNDYFGTTNTRLTSIDYTDASFQYPLRDYYIKSAYNCCCIGNYSNDFVNLTALLDILKQGVRWLDFEIFSINDSPVIAVSTTNSCYEKESYNFIPFLNFITSIKSNAFNPMIVSNYNDPLFFHIRFKSNNIKMYNNLSNMFEQNLSGYLLSNTYNYNYMDDSNPNNIVHRNLGNVPLNYLGQNGDSSNNVAPTITIVVSNENTTFKETPFYEYVNMISGTVTCNLLTANDVQYYNDTDELINHNKIFMTFEIPNINYNPSSPNVLAGQTFGIQCIGMRYIYSTNFNSFLVQNEDFFDSNGTAFVLKPSSLRYIPTTFPLATPLPSSYSFSPRDLSFNVGSRSIPGQI